LAVQLDGVVVEDGNLLVCPDRVLVQANAFGSCLSGVVGVPAGILCVAVPHRDAA
jgi:hypothetical protein